MTDAEIDALAAKESAPPAALTDADIDRLSATTMPKQTGKRFIEPLDDDAPTGLVDRFSIAGQHKGLAEGGNIDLTNRPNVANADGSHSSVRSMSFEDNGKEILVPTVSDDGRIMSEDEAIAQYRRTGRHLGKFDNPDNATAYAEALHNQQAANAKPGSDFNDIAAQIARARAALGPKIDTSPVGLAKQAAAETGQGFKDLGNQALAANDFAARSLVHPVDTFGGGKAPAVGREFMRGVNANIPFANRAVQALGGPATESPEDAALAPGAQAAGTVAGLPVGNMVGGIAAKGLEAAAPIVSKAAGRIGEAAEARQAARVIDEAKVDATKTLRSNIKVATPRIEAVLTSDPELTARLLKTRGKPEAMNHILLGELESAGKQIGSAYADADTVALGAPLDDVRRALHGAARSYNNPADKPLKDQITRLIDNFDEQFAEGGRVPLSKLWETRQSLARRGFAGSVPDPTVQKELARDAASAIQSVIDKRFGEIKELSSNIAKSPGLSGASGPLQEYAARTAAIDRVPDLNKRFSALQTMQDAVKYKVNSDSEKKGFNLMNLFGHGHKAETAGAGIGAAAGAAAGHATGIPGAGAIGGVIGGAVGKRVGYAAGGIPAAADAGLTRVAQGLGGITAPPPQVAARSATALAYSSALDRLANMARTQPPAQFIDAAVRAGLPAEAARRIAAEAQKNRTQIADGAQ